MSRRERVVPGLYQKRRARVSGYARSKSVRYQGCVRVRDVKVDHDKVIIPDLVI